MITYNLNQAKDFIKLSTRCYCDLKGDKNYCKLQKLDAIDFCLWFDNSLLEIKDLSFRQAPFDFILSLVDKNHINTKAFFGNACKDNFRVACLLFSKFVKCDVERIHAIREKFLTDNPGFLFPKPEPTPVNFDSIFDYSRHKCNKMIFPYLYGNGVSKSVIAELISRQFIAFEEQYNNIIYICQDCLDYHGIEKHGIGHKHFMKLEGEPFPFVYFPEDLEDVRNDKFIQAEVFDTTLALLQYLSREDTVIYSNVLYVSLHTSNYNREALDNLRLAFPNITLNFHFEDEKGYRAKPILVDTPPEPTSETEIEAVVDDTDDEELPF